MRLRTRPKYRTGPAGSEGGYPRGCGAAPRFEAVLKGLAMIEPVQMWSTQPPASLWRTAGGWILLVLGVAGLMLPVLPGTPLLLAGLVMLSTNHRWALTCLRRAKLWTRKLRPRPAKPANVHPIVRGPEQVSRTERQPQPANISLRKESATMNSTHRENQNYPTTQNAEPAYNKDIRLRAYELFEQRGREDGHDLDDWLRAEAEFKMPARSQIRRVAA